MAGRQPAGSQRSWRLQRCHHPKRRTARARCSGRGRAAAVRRLRNHRGQRARELAARRWALICIAVTEWRLTLSPMPQKKKQNGSSSARRSRSGRGRSVERSRRSGRASPQSEGARCEDSTRECVPRLVRGRFFWGRGHISARQEPRPAARHRGARRPKASPPRHLQSHDRSRPRASGPAPRRGNNTIRFHQIHYTNSG